MNAEQPSPLTAEVRAAMKAAGMDPETDVLAPLLRVLVSLVERVERGLSPEGERAVVDRLAREVARAVEKVLRERNRAFAWRNGALVACGLLAALGVGHLWGGAAALDRCTVVAQPDGSRACIIVAWRR